MWETLNVLDGNVGKLNVEKLVHRLEGPRDGHVVFELHPYRLANEGFEKGVEYLAPAQEHIIHE